MTNNSTILEELEVLFSKGLYEEGLDKIEKTRSKYSDSLDIRAYYGRFLFKIGRVEEGMDIVFQVLEADIENSTATLAAGEFSLFIGDLEKAENFITFALELYPDCIEAWYLLAKLAIEYTDWETAIDFLDNVLEMDDSFKDTSTLKADILQGHLGLYDEALAIIDPMLEQDPASEIPLNIKLNALTGMGRYNEAYEIAKILTLDEKYNQGNGWMSRGLISFNRGDYRKCIKEFTKFIKYVKEIGGEHMYFHVAYYKIGLANFFLENYNKALKAFKISAKIDPDDPVPRNNMAMVHNHLEHFNRALKISNRLVQRFPDYMYAWLNQGIAYKGLAKPHKAIQSLSRVLVLDPLNRDVHKLLIQIYTDMGKTKKARYHKKIYNQL